MIARPIGVLRVLAGIVLIVIPPRPGLPETVLGVLDGCYVRDYPKGAVPGNYSSIRVLIGPRRKEPVSRDLPGIGVYFRYKHWSLPSASLGYDDWSCGGDGEAITCSIECDGGRIYLRPLANGDLLLESERLRVSEGRISSLLLPQTDSHFFFSGTHVLRRATPEMCSSDRTSADDNRVLFQPGDLHPMIAPLSRQLAKLGFLSAPGGPLYSAETEKAMRAFQLSMGLEPTGKADAKSVRLLNIEAITQGGC